MPFPIAPNAKAYENTLFPGFNMKNRSTENRLLHVGSAGPVRNQHLDFLVRKGFQVLRAETGQRALQMIRDNLVDGVILECGAPFARHCARSIRSRTLEAITDACPFLPLVLLCPADVELSHRESLMADMVLFDPIERELLLDTMEAVLEETLRDRAHRKAGRVAVLH